MQRPKTDRNIPGPIAKEWIQTDSRFISPSYTRGYPLVALKGRGSWIEDPDGNRFLDFTAGIAVTATGHCHPKVVKAIQDQAAQLIHMSGTDFYYTPQVKLAQKLSELAPGEGEKKVFFCNSGAEAVEAAFKLARWKTQRELNIAFFGAFHGRTMGALSLTASKAIQKRHYNPLVPGITHIPYGYCYRCPYNQTYPSCGIECVRWIEETLFKTTMPAEEVAAVFVEPIQGEGGYVVPPPEWHKKLREVTKKYGILYVADEVQAGMGRTGKMFAMENFGVDPDIMTLAKGIASGMPLGAMIAGSDLMTWEAGSHASTFGGNPVCCSAALATIELLEESIMANAVERGKQLRAGLRELQKEFESIGDVRGLGLMVGAELVKDRETKERAPELVGRVIDEAFARGLLLLSCGQNTIRFCSALTISAEEVDTCLEIVAESLKAAGA